MTWVQRLKRVFKIDIETCPHWAVTVITSIEDPVVIKQILGHVWNSSQPNRPAWMTDAPMGEGNHKNRTYLFRVAHAGHHKHRL